MDHVKIKPGHILNRGYTILEIGALTIIQALVAQFEQIPTPEERRKHIPDKLYDRLAKALEHHQTTIAEVLDEVCKDIAKVMEHRQKDNEKVQKFRNKAKKALGVTVNASAYQNSTEHSGQQVTVTPFPEPDPGPDLIPDPEKARENIKGIINLIEEVHK